MLANLLRLTELTPNDEPQTSNSTRCELSDQGVLDPLRP